MSSPQYIAWVIFFSQLIWGPIGESLVIRIGCLIVVPVAAWLFLEWAWSAWRPDAVWEDRVKSVLAWATGGGLVVLAITEAMAHTHIGNTRWVRTRDGMEAVGDDIVLPGPDWGNVAMILGFAGIAFWVAVGKRRPALGEMTAFPQGLKDFHAIMERCITGKDVVLEGKAPPLTLTFSKHMLNGMANCVYRTNANLTANEVELVKFIESLLGEFKNVG